MVFFEMARLIDIASGYPVDLPRSQMTFGTAPDNTIPIAEGYGLNAHHFHVTPVPGGNLLVDVTGQHATFVNDQPVSQVMLKNGDVITAGQLKLRYESQAVPPPLPPEDPPPVAAESSGPLYNGHSPRDHGLQPAQAHHVATGTKIGRKGQTCKDGGKTFLPNAATAIHLFKWILPALGIILWLVKWGYGFYRVKDGFDQAETVSAAYALVETYREAREAKAPQIQNVRDPGRLVRLLVRGVYGSGEETGREFRAPLNKDQADDALEMLTWEEGDGLTFKYEYREHRAHADGMENTSPAGVDPEALAPDEV